MKTTKQMIEVMQANLAKQNDAITELELLNYLSDIAGILSDQETKIKRLEKLNNIAE